MHDKKLYVCQELLTENWIFSCVATDKEHPYVLQSKGFREKYALYFYSARLLLERLSWYARDNGYEKSIPIFEFRSNLSYTQMRDYFNKLRNWLPPEDIKISWNHIETEKFKIKKKRNQRLLQAADCVCGSIKDGLEYSGYGFIEPRYILSLQERLYRRNRKLFSYGLKFLHSNATVLSELKREYEWLNMI
jgi:hypothetical protein